MAGKILLVGLVAVWGSSFATPVEAQDLYHNLEPEELVFAPGETPSAGVLQGFEFDRRAGRHPYVTLDGPGEGYVCLTPPFQATDDAEQRPFLVSVRAPRGQAVRGHLFLPEGWLSSWTVHAFELPEGSGDPEDDLPFLRAKHQHYAWLSKADVPGGAWFRHQTDELARELQRAGLEPAPGPTSSWSRFDDDGELERSYDLFTGGRALAENLQLDRVLEADPGDTDWKPIGELEGITTEELDWKPLIEGLEPELDPLARLIPFDQHAVFFPSFGALVELLDEAEANGAPVVQLLEPRAEDARTRERYERQLCLELDALARVFGGTLIDSIAMTGSDPYLRTGSDVAVIFETRRPEELMRLVAQRMELAAEEDPDDEVFVGDIAGFELRRLISTDGSRRSSVTRTDGAVIVTNSTAQLEAIGAVIAGERASLASLDEYIFFRARYPRGEEGESAFAIVSDATIRRWCGPRWRIGAARRTRAAALMADEQARHLKSLARSGVSEDSELSARLRVPGGGALWLTPHGVESQVYGTLDFLTPIAELDIERVTAEEARSYERFRSTYQNRWRQFFDPVALRVALRGARLELDLSVMPLILGSDYADLADISTGAPLAPEAGDPHPGALLHWVQALQRESETFKQLDREFSSFMPGDEGVLGWLGDWYSFYVEEDPVWDDLAVLEDPDDFIEEHLYELPVALHVAVRDPLRLAAFLTSLRALADTSAPNLLEWSTREHQGVGYVCIEPQIEELASVDLEQFAIWYVSLPDALVVSLREDIIQRAIERRAARREGGEDLPELRPWPGESWSVRARAGVIDVARGLFREPLQERLQTLAWGNLPILNEWVREFPDRDPLEIHQALWQVALVCPGGGTYVWNEEFHTVESTLYGHPGAPVEGPALPAAAQSVSAVELGVTFERLVSEDTGLRARAIIDRE